MTKAVCPSRLTSGHVFGSSYFVEVPSRKTGRRTEYQNCETCGRSQTRKEGFKTWKMATYDGFKTREKAKAAGVKGY